MEQVRDMILIRLLYSLEYYIVWGDEIPACIVVFIATYVIQDDM